MPRCIQLDLARVVFPLHYTCGGLEPFRLVVVDFERVLRRPIETTRITGNLGTGTHFSG